MPFSKITISHICEECNMTRKSFYYHFRDKNDLISWIFSTEFLSLANEKHYDDSFSFLLDLCRYLEENNSFYSKILIHDDQNSFSKQFENIIFTNMQTIFEDDENHNFCTEFFSAAVIISIKKWLLEQKSLSPEKFVSLIKLSIHGITKTTN